MTTNKAQHVETQKIQNRPQKRGSEGNLSIRELELLRGFAEIVSDIVEAHLLEVAKRWPYTIHAGTAGLLKCKIMEEAENYESACSL